MFQTGSTINPALGRTDYSAYAQGAVAGGQAIGQGIANLGQSIASGIEAYTKKKEAKKELETAISGFTKLADRNPQAAEKLGLTSELRKDPKAIASVVKSLGGPAAANSLLFQFAQQQQQFDLTQSAENRKTNVANDAFKYMQTGEMPVGTNGVLDPRYKSEVERTAYQMGMERDIAKAKIASEGAPKNLPEYLYYIKATPEQRKVLNERSQAGANTTQLTTVPGIKVKIFEDLQEKRDKVLSLGSTKVAYKDALEAIEQGAFSGAGAEAKTALAKVGQLLGFNNWDSEIAASEFYRSRLAQPVFDLAQSFKGALSDSDRIFLQKSALGDIKYSPDSIKRMLILSERLETEARKTYLKDIKRIYGNSKEASDVESFRALSFDEDGANDLFNQADAIIAK